MTTQALKHCDVELLRSDTQEITIPVDMDLTALLDWVTRRIVDENQKVVIDHTIDCMPMEGAHALATALSNRYGWTSLTPKKSWWGDDPPRVVSLRTGVGESVGVPWGLMVIPGVNGYLETQIGQRQGTPVLRITGEVQRKNEPEFRAIIHEAERLLATSSIYRGNALRMQFINPSDATSVEDFQPEFMDLSTVDEDQLVFPEHVEAMINASVFGPIENTEACRRNGIPLKRGNLLAGPYGCGKTLTAKVLAKKCARNGWTFLLIPNVDQLAQAVEFARRYQPCVIFSEDIDQALTGSRRDSKVNEILNVIDGIESKDTEIMVVLTTNHVERINAAMLRPGRLDAVIPVEPPDARAAIRLVEKYTGDLLRMHDLEDLEAVGERLAGQIPAVIREVCERSKLTAIARTGDATEIYPADLLVAAEGMKQQMRLLQPQEPDDRSDLEKAAAIVGSALSQGKAPSAQPEPTYPKNGKISHAGLV